MYCAKCGTKNDDDSRYCFKCGDQLAKEEVNQIFNNDKQMIGQNYESTLRLMIGLRQDFYINEFRKLENGVAPKYNWERILAGGYPAFCFLRKMPFVVKWNEKYKHRDLGEHITLSYYNSILNKLDKYSITGMDVDVEQQAYKKVKRIGGVRKPFIIFNILVIVMAIAYYSFGEDETLELISKTGETLNASSTKRFNSNNSSENIYYESNNSDSVIQGALDDNTVEKPSDEFYGEINSDMSLSDEELTEALKQSVFYFYGNTNIENEFIEAGFNGSWNMIDKNRNICRVEYIIEMVDTPNIAITFVIEIEKGMFHISDISTIYEGSDNEHYSEKEIEEFLIKNIGKI